MSSTRRFLIGCLALTAALACPPATSAQQQLGAIQGTIVDGTRAVMPGVSVTVTNLDTGVSRSTVSNETGVYRVFSLDPGRYKITAELQGFRTAAQNEEFQASIRGTAARFHAVAHPGVYLTVEAVVQH